MRHTLKQFYGLVVALTLICNLWIAGVGATPVENGKIVINIPSRTLWLYSGNQIVKYFPVGVGRVGFQTPLGKYNVIRKVKNPGWENPYLPKGQVRIKPGEANPLGTRWIGFKEHNGGEYGIHGTDNPSSVGKLSSHGCVRMLVKDAEDLFERVQVGTPVEVIYDTALVRRKEDVVNVIVYPDPFGKGKPTVEQVRQEILAEYPGAEVDVKKLRQALLKPQSTPIAVGKILDMPQVAKAPQPVQNLEAERQVPESFLPEEQSVFNEPGSAAGL